MPKHTQNKLYGCKGCGSVIAEAFLKLGGITYDYQEVNYDEPGKLRDELESYNPLIQVPTLVLENGTVLTETLAIANYVNDRKPSSGLLPNDIDLRAKFHRWSVFIIAALYPTWTYGDDPKKWIKDSGVAPQLRESTDQHRKKLWKVIEREVTGPYFLGDQMCAIDIYVFVMSHWRPRQEWFKENCPKLFSITQKVAANPELKQLWQKNF